MSQLFFDRIKETTTTTGIGTLSLDGALTGFREFSTIGDGNTCYYTIDDGTGNWEVGSGTYASGGNTLARTSVLASSNSNLSVNFGAGTKTVWLDVPATWFTSIPNANLANSSVTISGHALSLGSSLNLASGDISGLGTLATLNAAPAGTLTGTTLASNVVTSSLTTIGTLVGGSIPYSLVTGGPVAFDSTANYTLTGVWTHNPAARASGVAPYWSIRTPADTGLTLNSEAIGVQIGGSTATPPVAVIRTFADGTIASQREYAVIAPKYAGTSAGVTITTSSTFDISGSPTADAHCTLGSNVNFSYNYAFTVGGSASPVFSVGGSQANGGGVIYRDMQIYGYETASGGATITNPLNYIVLWPHAMDSSTINTSDNIMRLECIFPTVPTVGKVVANWIFTTSGSSAFNQTGLFLNMKAGYTGTAQITGGWFFTPVAGTGTAFGAANMGGLAQCTGVTTGHNTGFSGQASGALINNGLRGIAVTNAASKSNIGVAGYGLNGGATPATTCGGYFALRNAYPTFDSTFSAALTCDNGSATLPIFLAMDNGTAVFTIADGGGITATGGITALTFQPATQQTYSASNVTTDRTYDANATTVDELADVLGTLIADLRAIKLVL